MTARRRPRVTVLMCVYNAERYLRLAIDSILRQTYKEFELLIVDDGSAAATKRILASFVRQDPRVRVLVNEENRGIAFSANRGLAAARGELIARMDSDDIALPHRLARQVAFLDEHPAIALVGTWADVIDASGTVVGELRYATEDRAIRSRMVERNQFINPSVMFRRGIIDEVGVYDPSFPVSEDYDLIARILSRHKGANIPEKLLRYRQDFSHSISFTAGKRAEWHALRTRWRMVARYGWPAWALIKAVKPLLSFFVPSWCKMLLFRSRQRRGRARLS